MAGKPVVAWKPARAKACNGWKPAKAKACNGWKPAKAVAKKITHYKAAFFQPHSKIHSASFSLLTNLPLCW